MNAKWYYAQGDKQLGPVSQSELERLLADKNLSPDDLIWREGMSDWAAASRLPELLEGGEAAASDPAPPPRPGEGGKAGVGAVERARQWAERARPLLNARPPLSGRALLLAGLVLVLSARGCQSLSERQLARTAARSEVAQQRFEDEWESQRTAFQQRIDSLRQEAGQLAEVAKIEERLSELNAEKQAEKMKLENGRWRDLAIAARDAEANLAMWSYWRQWWLLLGTIALGAGLVAVARTGDPAERWICLVMLAIIVWSLYVGGAAW